MMVASPRAYGLGAACRRPARRRRRDLPQRPAPGRPDRRRARPEPDRGRPDGAAARAGRAGRGRRRGGPGRRGAGRRARTDAHAAPSPSDLPPVSIDRVRIRQILINLLNNAARFTDRGGVTVERRAARQRGRRARCADTGVGIPPEEVGRVFEEFHQAPRHDRAARRRQRARPDDQQAAGRAARRLDVGRVDSRRRLDLRLQPAAGRAGRGRRPPGRLGALGADARPASGRPPRRWRSSPPTRRSCGPSSATSTATGSFRPPTWPPRARPAADLPLRGVIVAAGSPAESERLLAEVERAARPARAAAAGRDLQRAGLGQSGGRARRGRLRRQAGPARAARAGAGRGSAPASARS